MNTVPVKGAKRRLTFALFLIVWLFKLISGIIDVNTRHIPNYPEAVKVFPYIGQMGYVVITSFFVALNLLMSILARKIPKWLAIFIAMLQIFMLLTLLLFSSGGI
ncbi:hypothetical protein [Xanthomonas fragariae]|uniref:hypothetical protein n=1 Tax=Xanthomonas fragariae TaxID=48664 RepID=UPI0022AA2201|nr:hypothetical protein [Xanthomonas fragariae]WAT14753.1 hypothetical protein OZ429_17700 [Xanthomonas fragariae]